MNRKLFWVRAEREGSVDPSLLSAALEAGAEALLVPGKEAERVRGKGVVKIVSEDHLPQVDILLGKLPSPAELAAVERLAAEARRLGKEAAVLVEVRDKEMEQAAARAAGWADYVVVWGKDWKIIPLENLIAALHRRGGKLLALVRDAGEARVALETLELGADGVLLEAQGPEEVRRTGEVVRSREAGRVELVPARVVRVKAVGSGDRACVDTCSLLREGEGMLVGSQAEGMFLVHSETVKSEFVETRPFRVNAGAVHGYIMVPGRTRYLSELSSGEEVLVVDASGRARPEVVGRVKIERRPLLLVEAVAGERSLKVVLQNAETINLVSKEGKPLPVTRLKEGDEVLVHLSGKGRHFGMAVEESVIER